MFTKLTIICMAFVPLIICGGSTKNPTRVGKFLGWFSVDSYVPPVKLFTTSVGARNRRWGAELSLTFVRHPLIAGSEEHHYFLEGQPEESIQMDNNFSPSFEEASETADNSTELPQQPSDATSTTELPLDSTMATVKSSKLEDYEEFTFDPSFETNRVKREAPVIEDTGNPDESTGDDATGEMTSTTLEPSATQVIENVQDQSPEASSSFVTLSPPLEDRPHQNFYFVPEMSHHFPYPPSQHPSHQYVPITQSPHHKPYPPIKSYYDFNPSQPDFIPYCYSFRNQFTPNLHDTWSFNHKWK